MWRCCRLTEIRLLQYQRGTKQIGQRGADRFKQRDFLIGLAREAVGTAQFRQFGANIIGGKHAFADRD